MEPIWIDRESPGDDTEYTKALLLGKANDCIIQSAKPIFWEKMKGSNASRFRLSRFAKRPKMSKGQNAYCFLFLMKSDQVEKNEAVNDRSFFAKMSKCQK